MQQRVHCRTSGPAGTGHHRNILSSKAVDREAFNNVPAEECHATGAKKVAVAGTETSPATAIDSSHGHGSGHAVPAVEHDPESRRYEEDTRTRECNMRS